ncbi:MAG TPA: glycosyltransferase family 61 protein [Microbacterium sp.]|uniref:glycosyltransferase family 61 protein n=1 Tax=Microbacterium sp. TaxID=51671 RepID=UPI002B4A6C9A|nr:glycosyltransferase family 61 protein [Microbacterium sp.]HKT55930.1 glycosyltransferase family 61 protein [Microbacterium sp.]
MTPRNPARRAFGYALSRWRRRPPAPASSAAPDVIRRALPERDGWRVVLLADRPARWHVQQWLRTFFHDDVLVFSAGFTPSRSRQPGVTLKRLTGLPAVAAELRTRPPADLVVDLRTAPDDDAQRDAWRRLFVSVAADGAYVHRDLARQGAPRPNGWARAVAALTEGTPADDLERALVAATGEVRAVSGYAVHLKSRAHYLKVPDRRADVLGTRAPELSVELMDTVPAAEVTDAPAAHGYDWDDPTGSTTLRFTAPAASMRHYRGPVHILSHAAAVHDSTLLPPSFGYPTAPVPLSVLATDVTNDYATIPTSFERELPRVSGDIFDLNPAYHAHFGHFITEVPAKLWGWDAAKAAHPGLRAMLRVPPRYEPTYERELLYAYGLREEDILWQPEPARVDSFISCTPLWQAHDRFVAPTPQWKDHEPHWFHPAVKDAWARIRSGLIDPGRTPGPRRLFVTRPTGMRHRDCRNAPAVEALFEEYGFTVVRPEHHTLADQANLFADATAVAGFGGSGMFNLLFAEQVRDVIVLNHEAYRARNEHLYAAALGARSHTYWSTPDIPQRGTKHDPDAFHSAWAFDFARNEGALRATLAALDS